LKISVYLGFSTEGEHKRQSTRWSCT